MLHFFHCLSIFKLTFKTVVLPKPAPSYTASGFAPNLKHFSAQTPFAFISQHKAPPADNAIY